MIKVYKFNKSHLYNTSRESTLDPKLVLDYFKATTLRCYLLFFFFTKIVANLHLSWWLCYITYKIKKMKSDIMIKDWVVCLWQWQVLLWKLWIYRFDNRNYAKSGTGWDSNGPVWEHTTKPPLWTLHCHLIVKHEMWSENQALPFAILQYVPKMAF